jgi:hypothetical protein
MNEDDTFEALKRPLTEDEKIFGRNCLVYCKQHLRPHSTGWCSVDNDQKVALKSIDPKGAYAECKELGFEVLGE